MLWNKSIPPTLTAHLPAEARTLATLGIGQKMNTVGSASTDLSLGFRGHVSEVLLYNTALTEAQKTLVSGYFTSKYAYPPATAPVSTTMPTRDLALWLKADAISGLSDGAAVSAWTDSSGNNRTMVQHDTNSRPTYRANALKGKPAVRFDGVSSYLGNSAYMIPATGVTYAVAFRTLNSDRWGEFIGNLLTPDPSSSTNDKEFGLMHGNPTISLNYYGYYDTRAPITVNDNAFHILVAKFDSSGSRVYVDGLLQEMGGVGNSVLNYSPATIIGAGPYYGYLNGDIGELMVYHRSLTNRELDELNGYLMAKYNGTSPNMLPTCSMSMGDGAGFLAGDITLSATAADPDGAISKVEFYQGSTKLGEDTTSPYNYTWTAGAGSYTISAKAYDNSGGTTESPAVNITVTSATIPTSGLKIWLHAGQS